METEYYSLGVDKKTGEKPLEPYTEEDLNQPTFDLFG